jgi:hypothetical protein
MLRTALFAVLLTGLASTAVASDRVRVVVAFDSGHGYHSVRDHGYYRDYRHRGHYHGYDRRWDRGRHYGWRGDRYRGDRHYYSRPYYSRPYYRSYDRGYYYGSRGYRHDRYCPDRWHRH